MKLDPAIALPVWIALLSACIPAADNSKTVRNPPEPAGSCDASGLGYAIGKTLTKELEVKLKSDAKASVVRVAPHNGVVTMDFSPARLNMFIDDARKIIRINCG